MNFSNYEIIIIIIIIRLHFDVGPSARKSGAATARLPFRPTCVSTVEK